jgi:hypothetical protein
MRILQDLSRYVNWRFESGQPSINLQGGSGKGSLSSMFRLATGDAVTVIVVLLVTVVVTSVVNVETTGLIVAVVDVSVIVSMMVVSYEVTVVKV